MTFRDPRFVIAYTVIALFAGAYVYVHDAIMTGALIGAFSSAVGYYLGSSSNAAKSADNTGKALDLASTAAPTPPTTILQPGESATAAEPST